MNPQIHALRTGVTRGVTDFKRTLTHIPDLGFYVGMSVVLIFSTWGSRDTEIGELGILVPTYVMPSLLGGIVAFIGFFGVAYAISAEREDGTILRIGAVPHGLFAYQAGQWTRATLEAVLSVLIVAVPGMIIFDGFQAPGLLGWLWLVVVFVLGLVATIPLGMMLGSFVRSAQRVGTWGMIIFGAMAFGSGIFVPAAVFPEWGQWIAQSLPMYWVGHGMRYAMLPDSALVAEIGGVWRPGMAVAALLAWAAVTNLVAHRVLRRAARRESASVVQGRRQKALAKAA